MNISQAASSSIASVGFGLYSAEEVRKLSVKRITNSITLDALLNPAPGGLWDSAFGGFQSHNCSTCRLEAKACPGHCGHIELPTRVYHCVFIDQAFRLLRAQCFYCHRFRMSKQAVDLYWCKLQLIRRGLLQESNQVEDAGEKRVRVGKDGEDVRVDSSDDDSDADEALSIIARRRAFVKKSIAKAKSDGFGYRDPDQNEAIMNARKAVIAEFKAEILKVTACQHCKAVSPSYRKANATNVFRKPLSPKAKAKNAQNSIVSAPDPLQELVRRERAERRKLLRVQRIRAAQELDEAVADLESSPDEDQTEAMALDEDAPSEQISSSDEETQTTTQQQTKGAGSFLQTESTTRKPSRNKSGSEAAEAQAYVSPAEVHAALATLFEREMEILRLIYQSNSNGPDPSADMFFVQNLLVPPNKYRKESQTGREEITEPAEHQSYRTILRACTDIWELHRELSGNATAERARVRNFEDLQRANVALQDAVNGLFDRDKSNVRGLAALRLPQGVKQKLEKKEGMFRMNIMGKRVNFAARSVISPDPNIETNEVGVPPVFAQTLTYPEPVTSYSFESLKTAVINGPSKWPGAVAIENENGQIVSLRNKSPDERLGLANMLASRSSTSVTGLRNKKVHRHLVNGDMVIMNRQPTLHKPSMMCHRARILHGEKTIRMHYANCNTYNADFDGDEMNMHFPQNEAARIEAMQIADTDNQYLSATAGEPLRGLIQDHITMCTWLTCADMFFTKAEYQELLYSCIRPEHGHTDKDRIIVIDPAVMRPQERWTGRQIITTLLLNVKSPFQAPLNMDSASQITGERWDNPEEGRVRVVDGEHLTGCLDKKQIGPKSNGLVHSVFEAYGPTVAGKFLSILSRLLTRMLNMRAHSCGIEDLLLTDQGNAARKAKIARVQTIGLNVATSYVKMEKESPGSDSPELLRRLEDVFRDDEKQINLDAVTNSESGLMTTEIWGACLPSGLYKPFPRNQMQTMTASGAKGTTVNASQISCNLGQQTLEGRRVPVMVSGKTLPSFKPFETNVHAGGYIASRFLTGVKPQEFYFSLMAGREGLIDTAVKTSRSGYLQRCLVKGLEGLRADYDTTVRDSDGTIVQALYGEDGLDVTKQKKLTDFTFLSKNFLSLFALLKVRDQGERMINEEAIEWSKSAVKSVTKVSKSGKKKKFVDPVLSRFPPFAAAGSTSESFYTAAKAYTSKNPDRTIRDKNTESLFSPAMFFKMLYILYARSVIEPGEAVGVVAAQSIGEPSTQMTLNTFHLAGFAAKNVTLGIPRLRELLMTASASIQKPTMTLYPIPELTDDQCLSWSKGISRLSLAEIIQGTSVRETLGKGMYPDSRIYTIRLEFFPGAEYTKDYAITRQDVGDRLETAFLRILKKLIKADIQKRKNEKSLETVGKSDSRPELGRSYGRVEEAAPVAEAEREGGESDEDDAEAGDGDATEAKRRANLDEGMTYEDPDESEAEIQAQGERDAADEVEDSDNDVPMDEGYAGSEGITSDEEGDVSVKRASKDRASRVKAVYAEVSGFKFDQNKGDACEIVLEYPAASPRVLLLNLVNQAARKTLIQEVEGLGSALFTPADGIKTKERYITTEGTNLMAMRNFTDIINPNRLLTNDVWAMRRHYGVEAARDVLIREIASVFAGHSIEVDHRHLTLVADYMTRDGGYLPFSRNGMREKSSAFAKMSFETTLGFLSSAIMDGEVEDLTSPSARITIGKVGTMGSGMCDVLMPVS